MKCSMEPTKDWDPYLCVSEEESLPLDGANIQLRVVQGMLLPRDKHAILHAEDSNRLHIVVCANTQTFPRCFSYTNASFLAYF